MNEEDEVPESEASEDVVEEEAEDETGDVLSKESDLAEEDVEDSDGEEQGEELSEEEEGVEEKGDMRKSFFEDLKSVPILGEIKRVEYTVILPETSEESRRRVMDVIYSDGREILIQLPAEAITSDEEELDGYEPGYDFFNVNGLEIEGSTVHDDSLVTAAGEFQDLEGSLEEAETADVETLDFLDREEMESFPRQIEGTELAFISVDRNSPLIVSGKESPGYEITYYSQADEVNVILAEYPVDVDVDSLGEESHQIDGMEARQGQTGFGEEYLAVTDDEKVIGAVSVEETGMEMLEEFIKERLAEV
ncbi:MAG: hypothetical protein MUP63_03650 [Candidatus Nanohaloarchaeota archaeon QJJ-7]|nr:hypothetical protein [Candidatus Nanohaloarchaeota archaeon QJJ-7]